MLSPFTPVFSRDLLLGWRAQTDQDIFFYGSRHTNETALIDHFSDTQFAMLRQVHGNHLVQTFRENISLKPEQRPEADAHWSQVSGLGLIARSADCIPILISHPDFICAIHAGWRGVLNEVVPLSFKKLIAQFPGTSKIVISYGPHILAPSFEVHIELVIEFQNQLKMYPIPWESTVLPHPDINKRYLNLEKILTCQLQTLGISKEQIIPFVRDTYLDHDLHSFRRDKTLAGRNINFVARRY